MNHSCLLAGCRIVFSKCAALYFGFKMIYVDFKRRQFKVAERAEAGKSWLKYQGEFKEDRWLVLNNCVYLFSGNSIRNGSNFQIVIVKIYYVFISFFFLPGYSNTCLLWHISDEGIRQMFICLPTQSALTCYLSFSPTAWEIMGSRASTQANAPGNRLRHALLTHLHFPFSPGFIFPPFISRANSWRPQIYVCYLITSATGVADSFS